MTFVTLVLAATALWHALAAWHFTFYPERTLARTTRERPVQVLAAELFRFLGGINLALVVLGVWACFVGKEGQAMAAGALAVANFSQFAQDVRVRRAGLAHGPFFTQILVGDLVFTGLNLAAMGVALSA